MIPAGFCHNVPAYEDKEKIMQFCADSAVERELLDHIRSANAHGDYDTALSYQGIHLPHNQTLKIVPF